MAFFDKEGKQVQQVNGGWSYLTPQGLVPTGADTQIFQRVVETSGSARGTYTDVPVGGTGQAAAPTTPAPTTPPTTTPTTPTTPPTTPASPTTTVPSIDRSLPNLQDFTDLRALDPTQAMPDAGKVNAVLQQPQDNEMMQSINVDPNATNMAAAQATKKDATVTTAAQANTSTLQNDANTKYDATKVAGTLPDAVAAEDHFTEEELLTGQLAKILQPDANGQFPTWATPALTKVQQMLAARGIDNSSIAGQAITAALLDAAVPIANANAAALQGIKLQNLNNRQQASLVTYQGKIQTLLSDQSADNASKQFNAASSQQVNEFIASLADSVNKFNATAANTINQFNAAQETSTSLANANMANTVAQANAQLQNQREMFNVTNALQIEQSNAVWRRQLNTQNTALVNETNRINALNMLQISNDAYNKIWQQFRDEASWTNDNSQADIDRSLKMAMLIKQYELAGSNAISAQDNQLTNDLWGAIGKVGSSVVGQVIGSFDTNKNGNIFT